MKFLLTAIIAIALTCFPAASDDRISSPNADWIEGESVRIALEELKRALNHSENAVLLRESRIDSLRTRLATLPKGGVKRSDLQAEIAKNFDYYQLDSAVAYYDLAAATALAAGDTTRWILNRSAKCAVLPDVGYPIEAISSYVALSSNRIDPSSRLEFFKNGARLYFSVSEFYPVDSLRHLFIANNMQAIDSVLKYSSPGTAPHNLAMAYKYMEEGRDALLEAHLKELMNSAPPYSLYYCNATRVLGRFYLNTGRTEEATLALVESVKSTLGSGQLDSRAMLLLAGALYSGGEVGLSYDLMRGVFANSLRSGAKMQAAEASQLAPLITASFKEQELRRNLLFVAITVLLALLLAGLVFAAFYMRRQMRVMKLLNRKIAEANATKESYFAHFLELCALYLDKLEEFSRLARRKITAGQVEELHEMIRSGKVIEEPSAQFYEKFDHAITQIFPGFADEVNKLLYPDRRIVPPSDSQLTTELRILAFTRLGIDDAGLIARFLGLSPNTIYTYRNKLRTRAIDRATFDENVMQIGLLR